MNRADALLFLKNDYDDLRNCITALADNKDATANDVKKYGKKLDDVCSRLKKTAVEMQNL